MKEDKNEEEKPRIEQIIKKEENSQKKPHSDNTLMPKSQKFTKKRGGEPLSTEGKRFENYVKVDLIGQKQMNSKTEAASSQLGKTNPAQCNLNHPIPATYST